MGIKEVRVDGTSTRRTKEEAWLQHGRRMRKMHSLLACAWRRTQRIQFLVLVARTTLRGGRARRVCTTQVLIEPIP